MEQANFMKEETEMVDLLFIFKCYDLLGNP